MSKLTFATMAVLCILFFSCTSDFLNNNTQIVYEKSEDSNLNNTISTRSANDISVTFTNLQNIDSTINCVALILELIDFNEISLKLFIDSNTLYSTIVSNVHAISAEDVFEVLVNSTTTFTTSEITVNPCNTELCYQDEISNISDSVSDIIIEEDLIGI